MCFLTHVPTDYTEGAKFVDAILDVVQKEAEGTDALQGKLICVADTIDLHVTCLVPFLTPSCRFPNYTLPWRWHWCRYGDPPHLKNL